MLSSLPPKMYQPYKFRLYPFPDQERELLRQLRELNYLWNHALEERSVAWKGEKRRVSYGDQCRSLTRWREHDTSGIGRTYSHVGQECLARLEDAFKHFFRRCKVGEKSGYPRYRRETYSLTYPDAYNGSVKFAEGRNHTRRLYLSKIGPVPVKMSREPPTEGLKTCTVKKEGDRWFAVLTYEAPDPAPPLGLPMNPVGIDLGLSHLATLSNGEVVEPPKFLRRSEKRLARAQRVLARRKKGSHNREKAKLRVSRCHAKVRDQRRDFAHKLTTGWARDHDLIAFEDMDLGGHMEGAFSKATADAGWGLLRQFSEYKERNRSGRHIEVPTRGTAQTCSDCGRLHDPPLTLQDRTYECPCGLRVDRDLNAARNVLNRALAIVPGGTGESTPVETGPPPARKGRRVRSKKQEPPSDSAVAR